MYPLFEEGLQRLEMVPMKNQCHGAKLDLDSHIRNYQKVNEDSSIVLIATYKDQGIKCQSSRTLMYEKKKHMDMFTVPH